jgi:hypothetical protein
MLTADSMRAAYLLCLAETHLINLLEVCIVILGLYFTPTIVASFRHLHHTGSVVVINVFLGWRIIGWWIVSLAMAVWTRPEPLAYGPPPGWQPPQQPPGWQPPPNG